MNKKDQMLVNERRIRRGRRVRVKVSGTAETPRLAIHRTLRHFSAQLIDDIAGKTLMAVTQKELKDAKGTKTEVAAALGTLLGEKATKAGVTKAVFDRRSNKYHGRVKAFADAAREAGLQF
jgi:large subunit ribosomal protein L18